MKKIFLPALCLLFLAVACNNEKTAESKMDDTKKQDSATAMSAKAEPQKFTYTQPDSATAASNWMAYATLGEAHKMMAKANGTWATEITWWDIPGGPSQSTKGTTVNKMIMGGKYQLSNFSGVMMGMPFEGMSTLAYDNLRKIYISTWIDNMGTGVSTMEGPWDEATKSISLKGKMVDAGIGKEMPVRQVFKFVDDNTQQMEMYKPAPDGAEFKCMFIKYTRKK